MHPGGQYDRAAAGARVAQGGYVASCVCEYSEMASKHGGLRRCNTRAGERKGVGAARATKSAGPDESGVGEAVEAADGDAAPSAAEAVQGADGDVGATAGERVQVLVWDPIMLHELRGLPRVYASQRMCWTPRALRDRHCPIWCGLIQHAVQSRDAGCANLLFFRSVQLLLRIPAAQSAGASNGLLHERGAALRRRGR